MKAKGILNKISNRQTVIVILIIGFLLWRIVMSLDRKVVLWESMCSGISLFVIGWILFGYIYRLSARLKDLVELSSLYRCISISTLAVNIYVLVYYLERWYRLALNPTYVVPLDFAYRSARFMILVLFYCSVIWMCGWLRKVGADYETLYMLYRTGGQTFFPESKEDEAEEEEEE